MKFVVDVDQVPEEIEAKNLDEAVEIVNSLISVNPINKCRKCNKEFFGEDEDEEVCEDCKGYDMNFDKKDRTIVQELLKKMESDLND